MPYQPTQRSPEQDAVLDALWARAEDATPGSFAILDLDGCLFDTRYRQIHILRAYAENTASYRLLTVRPEHFVDWDMAHTLKNAGFRSSEAQTVSAQLQEFWCQRVFQSEYTLLDHVVPGAVRLVRGLRQRGLSLVYLTGRHTEMRPGTERMLQRYGFPWGAPDVTLTTKADFREADVAYKSREVRALAARAPVAIALDNEPANLNAFDDLLPEALVVFVATDHSPRPDIPRPHLPRLRNFLRTTDALR